MPTTASILVIRTFIFYKKYRFKIAKLPALLICLIPAFGFGQTYYYTFKISGVTDLAGAKEITDPIRQLFNTEADPFRNYPVFNDATDQFDFRASSNVSRAELESLVTGTLGKAVISFIKEDKLVPAPVLGPLEHR